MTKASETKAPMTTVTMTGGQVNHQAVEAPPTSIVTADIASSKSSKVDEDVTTEAEIDGDMATSSITSNNAASTKSDASKSSKVDEGVTTEAEIDDDVTTSSITSNNAASSKADKEDDAQSQSSYHDETFDEYEDESFED